VEFGQSDGPNFHGAVAAWEDGATGTGEIIAIVDSGLDSDNPEFTGRIHPNSQDVAGNDRGIDPQDDHGTNVALVAAGGRNDAGVLGIAFDAQVLALRADRPGSCGNDTPQDPSLGCSFLDSDIARGIDVAVETGAAVVNLSLGGGNASTELQAAVARAAAAGLVIVVAAGNDGLPVGEVDPFSNDLIAAGGANVIVVGSVDQDGTISSFSNRAGPNAASYITALGERICCVYEDGEIFVETVGNQQFVTVFSGTSFAAPQVSGAVALLAQAFPNLTGAEIVEILLDTARDAGAAGIDSTYGTGILDIAAAFQPSGTTRIAGTDAALLTSDMLAVGSAAMGDALQSAQLSTIVTDRYDRAYTLDLSRRTANAAQVQRLRGAVGPGAHTRSAGNGALSLAVTVGEGSRAAGLGWSQPLQLTSEEAHGTRVLASRIVAAIAPDMKVGFALSQSAEGLVAQMQGASGAAFRIAGEAGGDSGFLARSDVAFASRHMVGSWGLTVSAERGRAWLGDWREFGGAASGEAESRPTTRIGLAADRRWGALETGFALSWLQEEETLLGAHFTPALGVAGADSVFIDGRIGYPLGAKWRLGASLRVGSTTPRGSSAIAAGGRIATRGWSLDLTRRSTVLPGDAFGLRVSQPLRVTGGTLDFDLPIAYDYASESAMIGRQSLSLSPAGRELIGELAWSGRMSIGTLAASIYYRREPGHITEAPSDAGALVSLTNAF
jgi:hypothetical protein